MAPWFKFVASLVEPPGLIILLLIFSLYSWMVNKKVRAALVLMLSTLLLYILSTAFCADRLLDYISKNYKAATFDQVKADSTAQTIVLLSAGAWPNYNGLLRSMYAAKLSKATNLPILVSGGDQEAVDMAKVLGEDFSVSGAILVEDQSRNTKENAKFVKIMLDKNNINDVFLVTNAWHMARALQAFKKQGINVIPAPVLVNRKISNNTVEQFIPKASNLLDSALFCHEYFGTLWYKMLAAIGN